MTWAEPVGPRRVARRSVASSAALAIAVLVVLSLAAQAVAAGQGEVSHTGALLVGFGASAAVALVVTLLEAFARPWWGVATAATACALYVGMATAADLSDPSAAGIATAAALVVAAVPLTALLARPERTLATLA
jgi:hypothetical protein